jgi:ABC-type Fe3+/spermidine/putrescine transport system ATPase subunit
VFENVAYGLRVRRAPAAEIKQRTIRTLELVGLAHLADRFATKLSGGQRQRVALARAIVYQPRVVLYDEPLSNLDAKLREQMRVELVRLQKEVGLTAIYVTHDQSEALVMSDRVVVMDKAVIQQVGDPRTIYARPANAFVANFIGVASLMKGTLRGRDQETVEVEVPLGNGSGAARIRAIGGEGAAAGSPVVICLRPEDLTLSVAPRDESGVNRLIGEVIDTVYLGSSLECRVRCGTHEIATQLAYAEPLHPGQQVQLTFTPAQALCLTR